MDLETISLMIDWLVYHNLPTRLNLLVTWQLTQWNDYSNYCKNCSIFTQKCEKSCPSCSKRSNTIDIHDYRLRSGLAYGTLAQLLSHIYETGITEKVSLRPKFLIIKTLNSNSLRIFL